MRQSRPAELDSQLINQAEQEGLERPLEGTDSCLQSVQKALFTVLKGICGARLAAKSF